DARMRKIARRARGAQWRAALEVDGVSRQVDGAVAGAVVPGPVDEVDPRLGRLQIGGTDLEPDEPGPPPTSAPVVWIDGGLGMAVGIAAAAAGHGVLRRAAAMPRPRLDEWIAQGLPVSVREAAPERWCRLTGELAAGRPGVTGVVDAGYTEVAPGSVTVIAVDPARCRTGPRTRPGRGRSVAPAAAGRAAPSSSRPHPTGSPPR